MSTNVPSMDFPGNFSRDIFYRNSEITVEKGDHLRLTDIQAGFDLSQTSLFKSSPLRLHVYAYLTNINWVIWRANQAGIDPFYPAGLKAPLAMSFGVKANF